MTISANTSASEIGKTAGKKIDKASSAVANKFNDFVEDVENFIETTRNLSGEDLYKAKAKLNERIAEAKESAEELGESIAKRTREAAKKTNEYAHKQPWVTVGVGVAVGLLVGYLVARD